MRHVMNNYDQFVKYSLWRITPNWGFTEVSPAQSTWYKYLCYCWCGKFFFLFFFFCRFWFCYNPETWQSHTIFQVFAQQDTSLCRTLEVHWMKFTECSSSCFSWFMSEWMLCLFLRRTVLPMTLLVSTRGRDIVGLQTFAPASQRCETTTIQFTFDFIVRKWSH